MPQYTEFHAAADIGFFRNYSLVHFDEDDFYDIMQATNFMTGVLGRLGRAERLKACHEIGRMCGLLSQYVGHENLWRAVDRLQAWLFDDEAHIVEVASPKTSESADIEVKPPTTPPDEVVAAGVEDFLQPPAVHAPPAPKPEWTIPQVETLTRMKLAGSDNRAVAESIGKDARQVQGKWLAVSKTLPKPETSRVVSNEPPVEEANEPKEPEDSFLLSVQNTNPVPRQPEPEPLDPAEWPDIKRMMLDGRTRERIAGDYDVTVEMLDAFIEARLAETRGRLGEHALSA